MDAVQRQLVRVDLLDLVELGGEVAQPRDLPPQLVDVADVGDAADGAVPRLPGHQGVVLLGVLVEAGGRADAELALVLGVEPGPGLDHGRGRHEGDLVLLERVDGDGDERLQQLRGPRRRAVLLREREVQRDNAVTAATLKRALPGME